MAKTVVVYAHPDNFDLAGDQLREKFPADTFIRLRNAVQHSEGQLEPADAVLVQAEFEDILEEYKESDRVEKVGKWHPPQDSGDSSQDEEPEEDEEEADEEPSESEETEDTEEEEEDEGEAEEAASEGTLSDDFPGVEALREAGVETYEGVRNLEDLTAVHGIGDSTADDIADALEG